MSEGGSVKRTSLLGLCGAALAPVEKTMARSTPGNSARKGRLDGGWDDLGDNCTEIVRVKSGCSSVPRSAIFHACMFCYSKFCQVDSFHGPDPGVPNGST